ncbi:hypothetical protein L596_001939 [Steinernema carpocapsae]|uniref:PXA domain-containing protein n=1 Tax=Steinernema carpocapsae TaxID=34508 RepID=A0A4U8UMP0_STECR|nr:hypothetical protein L596_001939 [Steinernema carpocapsae]
MDQKSYVTTIYFGGAAAALLGFFYVAGFSLFTALFCIFAVFAGGVVSSLFFHDAADEPNTICVLLDSFLRNRLKRNTNRPSLVEQTNGVGKLPWDGLKLPEPVNVAVEELIEQMLDNFVNSWYKTEISNDHAFLNEIRYQIRYASSILFKRIHEVDLSDAILNEIVPIAVVHAERILRIENGLDKHTLPPLMVETKILESYPDVHCIMTSRQTECDYLRSLADFLVGQIIDESRVAGRSLDEESPVHNITLPSLRNKRWPSQSCRHFLRELLVYSFFMPVLDLLADPDTINNLLVLLFDPEPMGDYPVSKSKTVPFLSGLTKAAVDDTPESLIQLKLSEIVRDHRHLQMFSMYLKDSKGPTNVLKFLLQADDVHQRMQPMGNGSGIDPLVKKELRADISTMYDNFAEPSSPEYVKLPEDLLEEFQSSLESGDLICLDRIIEKTYKLLYHKLQFDYVVTFCQSECYLGYLCGSPPEAIEELIQPSVSDKTAAGRRQAFGSSSQSSFSSFSQFRSRLWNIIIPQSMDGSSLDEGGSDISSGYYSAKGIEVGDEAACVVGSLAPNISAVRYPASSPENFTVPAIDITMADDAPDDGFMETEVQNHDPNKPQSGELICEKTRDMSRWRVQIPRIEPRRDNNGRTGFVYIISVERSDIDYQSPHRKWEVVRRYNEFYILESKLLEFHGDLIKSDNLPAKRTLRTKSREFVESLRLQFERYLQLLTQQSVLKRSDLLAVFLSGEEEISNNAVFSMSNTWKVVKKMPGKFSREKGQHMKPFLLHMMAVVLAPADIQKASDFGINGKIEAKSESSSMSSISFEQGANTPKQILLNSIYGNNCPSVCVKSTLFDYIPWTRSICQSLLFLIQRCFEVSSSVTCLLVTILGFFGSLDKVIVNLLTAVLGYSLSDSNVVQLVHLLQTALFSPEDSSSTEQEKVLRAELAQRRTVEYLQDQLPSTFVHGIGKKKFRASVRNLFSTLQHPRLNKQLSYVLLDMLVRKLFPEFRSSIS